MEERKNPRFHRGFYDAEGGTRTHTSLLTLDFESWPSLHRPTKLNQKAGKYECFRSQESSGKAHRWRKM